MPIQFYNKKEQNPQATAPAVQPASPMPTQGQQRAVGQDMAKVSQSSSNNVPQIFDAPDTSPTGWLDSHPWLKKGLEATGDFAKSIVKPVIRTGITGAAAVQDTANLLMGNKDAKSRTATGYNVPGFGELKPYQIGGDPTKGEPTFDKHSLESLGAGLEVGALVGSGGGASVAKKAAEKTALTLGQKLATPLIGGLGSLGNELQKEDVTPGSAATAFGAGAAFSKAAEGVGGALAKGKENLVALRNKARETLTEAFPYLTNIPKEAVAWAKKFPEKVMPKMKVVADAIQNGNAAEAEGPLRTALLDTGRKIYEAGKEVAQKAYDTGVKAMQKKFPNAKANVHLLQNQYDEALSKFKLTGADDQIVKEEIGNIIKGKTKWDIADMIDTRRELAKYGQALPEKSPAHALLETVDGIINDELNYMTKGAMKEINKTYSLFKEAEKNIRPVWSRGVQEDTARNFVSSLENAAKSGSKDAMEYLQGLAAKSKIGKELPKLLDEVKATQIARMMNWEKAPAGSRMRDDLVRTFANYVPEALGAGLGYVTGGAAGATAGTVAGNMIKNAAMAKLTSPRAIAPFLFQELEKEGVNLPPKAIQALGKILADPRISQNLMEAGQAGSERDQQQMMDEFSNRPSQLDQYEGFGEKPKLNYQDIEGLK